MALTACGAEKPAIASVKESNCRQMPKSTPQQILEVFQCVANSGVPSDLDEGTLVRLVKRAKSGNTLNQLLGQLLQPVPSGNAPLCKVILKWDSHVPRDTRGSIALLEDMLNKKKDPTPENHVTVGDFFKAVMLTRNISEKNVRGVTACYNLRYMATADAIGEHIQHDYGFLFLAAQTDKFTLPLATVIVGREVLAVGGFKPDHMQRLKSFRRMAGLE
ncbi:MAG TPA: hypothetical protein PKM44_15750 [Turneriella sp.]|nr:hypothetical protein [Turneriella sp.]HNE20219.1 hypothetical protein [Turneriella sp.]HNJ65728.1 hypothetical protein [Turneriella sp.]HNL11965.1 hypothetical protein [Turneriella sp.]